MVLQACLNGEHATGVPRTSAAGAARLRRGIGLKDVLALPDGRRAPDNAALVVEAILRYG